MISEVDAAGLESVQAWWRQDQARTVPRDHAAAELAVAEVYARAGWEPPHTILWFDSPFAGWLALPLVHQVLWRAVIRRPRRVRVWELNRKFPDLLDRAETAPESTRLARVGPWHPDWQFNDDTNITNGTLKAYLEWRQFTDSDTGELVTMSKIQPLDDEDTAIAWTVIDLVQAQLGRLPRDQARRRRRGLKIIHAEWAHAGRLRPQPCGLDIVKADAMIQLGLIEYNQLRPHIEVARHCSMWWARRDVAILADRPVRRLTDEEGRVHSDDGSAISWADGWYAYARHGAVRFPWDDEPSS